MPSFYVLSLSFRLRAQAQRDGEVNPFLPIQVIGYLMAFSKITPKLTAAEGPEKGK